MNLQQKDNFGNEIPGKVANYEKLMGIKLFRGCFHLMLLMITVTF